LVLLTVKRIRYLGKIIGVGCVFIGLIVLFFPLGGWQFRHTYTYASFVLFPVIGLATIIFTRSRGAVPVAEEAKIAGYMASEKETRRLEDRFQEMGKLFLLVPLTYTIVWMLLIYFAVEPTGILALDGAYALCVAFTWSVPMLLIIFIAIPYSSYKRYPDTNVLVRKSLEGARLIRMKRQFGESDQEDLGIMKEDESKREKKD
jgi:hypothetical protein